MASKPVTKDPGRTSGAVVIPPSFNDVWGVDRLGTDEGMRAAVIRIERSDRPSEQLRHLAEKPDILAFVLSDNYRRIWPLLERELLDILPPERDLYVPTDPQTYVSSAASVVLPAFASFFSSLAPPNTIDVAIYKAHNQVVPLVDLAIEAVILITKEDKARDDFDWDAARNACDQLHVAYPSTEEEAENLAIDLIMALRESMQFYLDVLADRDMTQRVRASIFRTVEAPDPAVLPPARPPQPKPIDEIVMTVPYAPEPTKAAYQTFRPDGAKRYLTTPDGFGSWHIYISSVAVKHLRDFLRTDKKTFGNVEKKIMQLSQGFFSEANHKRLAGGSSDIPIFEAKMTGDLHLVYQIDLETDEELKFDSQTILIYGIYTDAQFDHQLWKRVARSLPKNSAEYRRRITVSEMPRGRGAHLTTPMRWDHADFAPATPESASDLTEDEFLELHKMLSLEKFVLFSISVLQSILADVDASHAFKVSPTETRIIHHPSSCFVIGRSGTGKTTTMLFKLLGGEYANATGTSTDYRRQVFLTQSHILAQRVQEFYMQLVMAAKFGQTGPNSSGKSQGLFNLDEEVDNRGDLPERYSDLTDAHFPLFVTYDQIRKMLENDLGLDFVGHKTALRRDAMAGIVPKALELPGSALGVVDMDPDVQSSQKQAAEPTSHPRLITFNTFCGDYWPHIDQRMRKGLDEALVYSEIMGVISGHEATLASGNGYLDRETYSGLSTRAFPAFATERERIYDIFEKYRHLKTENNAYDSPDRTHAILRNMQHSLRNKIDFLYVDEVQDLLTIDTKLLRQLCGNPNGLFWGGDTAQTIAQGSNFRFEDLKALLWREENEEPLVKQGVRTAVQAETFELLVNYRSHGGIVDCAGSVISLISTLFPYSIDRLKKESAVVTGPKPAVFRGWDNDVIHFEQFLFGEGAKESRVDFGARQVILVRDDEAREELRGQLGDAGLILTLVESKGLEFDDVLIYGFFQKSQATASQWRVILSVMDSEPNAPRPDLLKHAVINSELKHLYVGITRARHHCWIWDSSDRAEPMVNYWLSLNLIKVHRPGDPMPQLQTASTPEEWNDTGRYLFQKTLFAQAASCFEKANRPQDRDISMAYQKRKDARRLASGRDRRAAFKAAGEAFTACGSGATVRDEAKSYHTLAEQCFNEAGEADLAAHARAAALDETEAAIVYRDIRDFDNALKLIIRPKPESSRVRPDIAKEIIELARWEFLANSQRYVDAAILFDNLDQELTFIRTNNLRQAHKSVLIHNGKPEAAAVLYEYDGEFEKAGKAWDDSKQPNARERAILALLDGLWVQTFNTAADARALQASLTSLGELKRNVSKRNFDEQITMFSAIADEDIPRLIELGKAIIERDPTTAVLCLDHALRYPPHLHTSSLNQISPRLEVIALFVGSVLQHLDLARLHESPKLSRLTGFKQAVDQISMVPLPNTYRVFAGSVLAKRISNSKDRDFDWVKEVEYYLIAGHHLDIYVRSMLELRVRSLINTLHQSLSHARLKPCLDFAIQGRCPRGDDCEYDESGSPSIDQARTRLRVHMQVIIILDHLRKISLGPPAPIDRLEVQKIWIQHITSVAFPIWHRFGNEQIIPSASITESTKTLEILQVWLVEHLEMLRSTAEEQPKYVLLSAAVSAAMLIFRTIKSPQWTAIKAALRLLSPQPSQPSMIQGLMNMLKFYEWTGMDALLSGITFVKHVVTDAAQMDVNVLLHLIEQISLEMTMNTRRIQKAIAFHDLMLPRSWSLYAVRHQRTLNVREPDLTSFLAPMNDLLSKIFYWDGTGADFVYEGRESPRGWVVKNVLIFRACRLLVLLGYNTFRTTADRTKIMTALTSIRSKKSDHSEIYNSFVQAKKFDDALVALRGLMPPSETDQLILLERADKRSSHALPNVRRIVWKEVKDIERDLSYDLPPFVEKVVPFPPTTSAPPLPPLAKPKPKPKPKPAPTARATAPPPPIPAATAGPSKKKKKKKKTKAASGAAEPAAPQNADPWADMPTLETVSRSASESELPPPPAPKKKAAPPKKAPAKKAVGSDSDGGPPPLIPVSGPGRTAARPPPSKDQSDSDEPPPLIRAKAKSKPMKAPPRAHASSSTSFPPFGMEDMTEFLTSISGDPKFLETFQEGGGYGGAHVSDIDGSDGSDMPDLGPVQNSRSGPRAAPASGKAAFVSESENEEEYTDDSDDPPPPLEPLLKSRTNPTPAHKQPPKPAPKPTVPVASSSKSAQAKAKMREKFARAIAPDGDDDDDDLPALEPVRYASAPKTTSTRPNTIPSARPAQRPTTDDDSGGSEPPPLEILPSKMSRR